MEILMGLLSYSYKRQSAAKLRIDVGRTMPLRGYVNSIEDYPSLYYRQWHLLGYKEASLAEQG
jgi:hypothetical protein